MLPDFPRSSISLRDCRARVGLVAMQIVSMGQRAVGVLTVNRVQERDGFEGPRTRVLRQCRLESLEVEKVQRPSGISQRLAELVRNPGSAVDYRSAHS